MNKLMLMMIPVFAFTGLNAQEKVPAINLSNLDTAVSPAVDFYNYATGGWQKTNPLKPEYARFGSFDMLNENNEKRINALFSDMTKSETAEGTVERKISDLYKMGLDSVKLNKEGGAPVSGYLKEIMSIRSKRNIIKEIALMHNTASGSPFFGLYVGADLKDSDSQILYISQSGLGIGDRDYYIDSSNSAIKSAYEKFLTRIFTLSGLRFPDKMASNALSIEDALARISWTSVEERDIQKQYNPMSFTELEKAYPHIRFAEYFKARGIPEQKTIVVCEPSFFKGLDSLLAAAKPSLLRDYLAGQLISDACGALSDDYYTASFDFYSKTMSGIKKQKPRWKRAMRVPNGILGEAVGKMYVEKYFPESSKKRMLDLVENLRQALGQHIDALDWMSDSTKKRAHEKLDNITVKIGYPDKWKDYSTLVINPSESYYENLRRAGEWYVADNMKKLGKPTDKTEWGMTPQTVNAYYNPTTNEICFPAAILQPPFFNPDADDAVNYGAIGVVIGHEMSHGFDDQGRLFDKDGNMENWWTAEDSRKFKEKAERLAAQFDSVKIVDGLYANGHLTLGENIGDHGGLSIAYTAMLNSFKGKHPAPVDGFTAEQRFYLSFGNIWAQNITDAEKARLTKLDVHSLARNRVDVSLRNFQSFFDAFGIKEGDPMFRPESERVHIW
ncbi:MAG: M13 family metallopeptidase [Bacteroidales bacterium]|nr:M13 family metallopeptidase [Bacteroidales bacterium]MCI1785188.1 M13 family metallopeptidase [Bacteroidales bacterium]